MNVRLSLAFTLATLTACASNSDATDGADDTGTTNGTMSPTDGNAGGLGAACDHAGNLGFANGPQLTPSDPLCGDALCAFPDNANPPAIACANDASCNAADLDNMRFACNDGTCVLNDAYKSQRSMCATSCSTDDDCAAADPGTACEFGFQCVIVSPSCCTPLCLCADDYSLGQVDFATAECEKQAEPSCAL